MYGEKSKGMKLRANEGGTFIGSLIAPNITLISAFH